MGEAQRQMLGLLATRRWVMEEDGWGGRGSEELPMEEADVARRRRPMEEAERRTGKQGTADGGGKDRGWGGRGWGRRWLGRQRREREWVGLLEREVTGHASPADGGGRCEGWGRRRRRLGLLRREGETAETARARVARLRRRERDGEKRDCVVERGNRGFEGDWARAARGEGDSELDFSFRFRFFFFIQSTEPGEPLKPVRTVEPRFRRFVRF